MIAFFLSVSVFILVFIFIGYAQNDKAYIMVGAAIFLLLATGIAVLNGGEIMSALSALNPS